MTDEAMLDEGDGAASFGPETVATYRTLLSQVRYACCLHSSTAELFSSANIELWEALCPNAMGLVQRSFCETLVLTICRICDQVQSGPMNNRQENCTFKLLADLVERDGRPRLAEAIRAALRWIETPPVVLHPGGQKKPPEPPPKAPLKGMRLVRNKYLGHLDQIVNVRAVAEVVVEGREVNQVLSTLVSLLEQFSLEYEGVLSEDDQVRYGTIFFGGLGDMPDGGFWQLIWLLHEVRDGRSPSWPGSTPSPGDAGP